jgi:phosphatidylglycerol:prolipoprotein diacylglycerol transferase
MLPILLDFGSLKIYATGTLWGLATLVAGITASRACWRRGYHPLWMWDLVAYGFIAGLITGRIGFFITMPGAFEEGFLEIFRVWKGGLSLHWGVLGGFTAAYFHSRRYGINFLHFADIWVPAVALGLAISRFGCLLGGH